MAAVYKALAKSSGKKTETEAEGAAPVAGAKRQNKQRVLILSSRGVTYR